MRRNKMSSRAKKIGKNVKKEIDLLYNSLFGSIILTVGITTGKTVDECRKLFNELKKHPNVLPDTISGAVDYIWTIFGNDDLKRVRAFYVLITDKLSVRSPMVTFVNEEESLMPLRPEGFTDTNIISLAAEGRDYIECEYLYDENGEEIEDEQE